MEGKEKKRMPSKVYGYVARTRYKRMPASVSILSLRTRYKKDAVPKLCIYSRSGQGRVESTAYSQKDHRVGQDSR